MKLTTQVLSLIAALLVSSSALAQAPADNSDQASEELTQTSTSESRYFISVLSGGGINFNTPLDIQIDDRDDINFSAAEYSLNAYSGSPYYLIRVGWMDESFTGWEFEMLHHKLYLDNKHPDIQSFEITDGYNGFTINKLFACHGLNFRVGAGVVITHPETIIYDRKYSWDHGIANSGYHLSGVGIRGSVGKYWPLSKDWFIETEAGLWATYTKIPVFKGEATVPHASFNADIGLGYFF